MELSQSCSGSDLDCPGDSLESLSEEQENKPPGSRSTEDLDALGSTSCSAGQRQAEGQSGTKDSAALEKGAIGRWIDAMGKWDDPKSEAETEQEKPDSKTPAGARAATLPSAQQPMLCCAGSRPAGIPALSREELAALGSFCSGRIRGMRRQQESPGRAGTAGKPGTAGTCRVPGRLRDRILLGNTRETVKQVTGAQIHEVSACPGCQRKEAELAKMAFLRQKKAQLEGALIQKKLEEQIYSRDVLTLIGEALRSLPKPSEDPRELWQRLTGQEM